MRFGMRQLGGLRNERPARLDQNEFEKMAWYDELTFRADIVINSPVAATIALRSHAKAK
jgi:hypothetical protein